MSAQRTVQKLWGWGAAPKLELISGKSWWVQKFKTYSFLVCWILVDMYHHWGPPIISVYCSFILLCVRCPAVKDNSRYDSLQFDIDVDTMLHGFGGYFYCVLYGDIAFSMLRTRWLSFFALQTTCILSCSVVSKSVGGFLKCSSMGIHTALWSLWPNRNVLGDCLKWLYDNSGCLRFRWQIVRDSMSSCTEGSCRQSWSASMLIAKFGLYWTPYDVAQRSLVSTGVDENRAVHQDAWPYHTN